MKRLLVILVLAAVFVGVKVSRRGGSQSKVLHDMRAIIEGLDTYEENADYLDALLVRHHPLAFDKAYDLGGRRRSATFDDELYLDTIFHNMVKECREDGGFGVCQELGQLRDELVPLQAER